MDIYFSIRTPSGEDPREWAHDMWDTYGFDYDLERCGETILAWPMNVDPDSVQALKDALDEDGIKYETFEADPDSCCFGCEPQLHLRQGIAILKEVRTVLSGDLETSSRTTPTRQCAQARPPSPTCSRLFKPIGAPCYFAVLVDQSKLNRRNL